MEDYKNVEVTDDVKGKNHTENEAKRTQQNINDLRAEVEARKAAKAAKAEEEAAKAAQE
jgi:hypothetical protein